MRYKCNKGMYNHKPTHLFIDKVKYLYKISDMRPDLTFGINAIDVYKFFRMFVYLNMLEVGLL